MQRPYHLSFKNFKRKCRKAKRDLWAVFCEDLNSTTKASGCLQQRQDRVNMQSLVKINSHPKITQWLSNMFVCRMINAQLCASTTGRKATMGTPQGGVISPLFWNIFLNDLLQDLKNQGCRVTVYADDLVLLITGKFLPIISDLMNNALALPRDGRSRTILRLTQRRPN